jgi:hypothetical protein
MKLLLLGALVFCIVLFVLGVIAPRRSRRAQQWAGRLFRRAERGSDHSAGRLGDATKTSLKKARGATEGSAEAGRSVNKAGRKSARTVRDRLS